MNTAPLPLLERLPSLVWFFSGMLIASLVVGMLLALAHANDATGRHPAEAALVPALSEPATTVPCPSSPRPGDRLDATCGDTAPLSARIAEGADAASTEAVAVTETASIAPPVTADTPAADLEPPTTASVDNVVVAPAPAEPAPAPADPADEVRRALQAWRAAWSDKDMPAYFRRYHAGFVPEGGLSHTAWVQQRQSRIADKPGPIQLELRDISIEVEGDRAVARFTQVYASPGYHETARKQLDLEKSGEHWQILRERSTG